jgi:hypothetical protein
LQVRRCGREAVFKSSKSAKTLHKRDKLSVSETPWAEPILFGKIEVRQLESDANRMASRNHVVILSEAKDPFHTAIENNRGWEFA